MMSDTQAFALLIVLAAVCIAAIIAAVRRAQKKPPAQTETRGSRTNKGGNASADQEAAGIELPEVKPEPRPEVVQRIKERMIERAKHLPPIALPTPKPKEHSARVKELKQNLLIRVLHNDATAARLLQFEIDEVKRQGLSAESSETLLERAIERLERDSR